MAAVYFAAVWLVSARVRGLVNLSLGQGQAVRTQ
jgi:hypothetical protein